jgi:ubiquitin-protein ligase
MSATNNGKDTRNRLQKRMRREVGELRDMENDEHLCEFLAWDRAETTDPLRGVLSVYSRRYPIEVSFPEPWPYAPPRIRFPDSRPSCECIDAKGIFHVDPRDWLPILTAEKLLLFLLANLADKGKRRADDT